MRDFSEYVEYLRGLIIERRLSPNYLSIRQKPTSKTAGTVGAVRLPAITLKKGKAHLEFFEEVEITDEGKPLVLAYVYQYVDTSYDKPLLLRFERAPEDTRVDHPEYHLHVEPLPYDDIRLPTGTVTLRQVLDLITHQFQAGT